MKTTRSVDNIVEKETNLETISMVLDVASAGILMSNMTNLYSNPNRAVLREYSANAIDSNVKAGINKPIEVTLTDEDLTVKDYGVGMSKDDVVNIYSHYGASTKRDNNKEIGGFGLGSKSALAITDRFDVISIKNGKRLEFYIEKSNSNIGANLVRFVSETDTQEPNGVEVTIPLSFDNSIDISTFIDEFFDTWPPNTVILNGKLVNPKLYDKSRFVPIISSSNTPLAWVRNPISPVKYSDITLIMNGILYTVRDIPDKYKNEIGKSAEIRQAYEVLIKTQASNALFNVPIGSIDLTPTRESIIFTDKTVNTIKTLLTDFVEQAPIQVAAFINTLDRADALEFYFRAWSLFGKGDASTSSPTDKYYSVTYRGEEIPTYSELNSRGDKYYLTAAAKYNSTTDSKFILFEGNDPDYKTELATVARNTKAYFAFNRMSPDRGYTYTNQKADKWLKSLTIQVSKEKLMADAKQYRSDRRRYSGNRGSSGGTRTAISYVNISTTEEYVKFRLSKDPIGELKGELFYLDVESVENRDWKRSFDKMRNSRSISSIGSDAAEALQNLMPKSTIVLLSKPETIKLFLKNAPEAKNLMTIIDKKKKELLTDPMFCKAMYLSEISSSRPPYGWYLIREMNQDNLDKIEDTNVKEIGKALKNNEISAKLMKSFYKSIPIPTVNDSDVNLSKKYPLINCLNNGYDVIHNNEYQLKVVDYLNMIHNSTK